MTVGSVAPAAPISDEHSVLLWQTCAYADDLSNAARDGRRLTPAYDAMLEFLYHRLLPYLADEERELSPARLRDDHMLQLLVADHERLRADVDNIEASRTRRLLALAATALVERLDRHVRREESWITDPLGDPERARLQDWALPLLLDGVIDVDALPPEHRDTLIRERLSWLKPGESVRLQSRTDLHRHWRRDHAVDPDAHIWVYEEAGPIRWRTQITRRDTRDL